MNSRFLGGLCAIAAFGLDQGTKALALNTPALERGVEVLPFLNLVRVLNDGVSFGMLGGIVPWWGLIALAAVIVAWLLIWLWRAPDRLTAAALGLIIGGALGIGKAFGTALPSISATEGCWRSPASARHMARCEA